MDISDKWTCPGCNETITRDTGISDHNWVGYRNTQQRIHGRRHALEANKAAAAAAKVVLPL